MVARPTNRAEVRAIADAVEVKEMLAYLIDANPGGAEALLQMVAGWIAARLERLHG